MTKYTIESLDNASFIQLAPYWEPHTLPSCAYVTGISDDATTFESMTEACLVIYVLETQLPRLMDAMNFVPVPVSIPDPQFYFPL